MLSGQALGLLFIRSRSQIPASLTSCYSHFGHKTSYSILVSPNSHIVLRLQQERECENVSESLCQGDPGLQACLAPSSLKPLLMSLAICCSAALPILTKSSSTLLQMPIRHFFPELQRLCVIWLSSPNLQHDVPDASTPLLRQVCIFWASVYTFVLI